MFNYVVTAHRPTAIPLAVAGNFTAPNELNLILSKTTRIEIHRVTAKGLELHADVPIYGRVAAMELVRLPGDKQDSLFISLEKYRFCVLTYDSATGEIKTRANGDTHDRIGRPTETGQIVLVDPAVRAFGLHIYDGQLRIIPVDNKGALQESFNIRLEELAVIDMKFLHGSNDAPVIAILYQDAKALRHIKTYQLRLREKELAEGPWQYPNCEQTSSLLIPVPAPAGGVLILSETTIAYHGRATGTLKAVTNKFSSIKAWGRIDADGSRYLVSDSQGVLGLIVLLRDGNNVTDIKLEVLGETTTASTIKYLDNGYVFVGSVTGDSQLVKLLTERNAQNNLVDVIDTYANLAPIIDFCVVDLERQGQGQVVTCSGTGRDGSLRIIRNGIGLNEQATIDLTGVKGIWNLRGGSAAQYDKFLVVSFVNETRFLAITEDEELEDAEIAGFASNSRTIYCGNVMGDMAVQVTSTAVRLINATSLALLSEWKPPTAAQINVASCNQSQVLLATGGGRLTYLEIQANQLREVKSVVLEHEIACVNVSPLGDQQQASSVCAIGMWTDISVRILRLPSLELITKEKLGGDIIPRSLLFVTLESVNYLLCGLGDGHLFSFIVDPATYALSNAKKLSLGTQPILLNAFYAKGVVSVFAASDRPMVIYSRNKKLLYSTVNLKEVYFMCPFNTSSYPECLAVATESALTIGNIDEIQKLHIRKVAIGETPRRIAHQESSRMFGVVTSKITMQAGEEIESNFFRLIDDSTFEVVDTFALQPFEAGTSTISLGFSEEMANYFALGTAFILPTEAEPTKGRIIIFSVNERKLSVVCEMEVKGSVYSMNALNGKLLASVNSRIRVFGLGTTEAGGRELQPLAQTQAHILALNTAVRGDFIAVGDLMKSINLNVFKPTDNSIEEIARDYNPNWVTAIEILDDDTYIGCEQYFNLFVVRRNSDAPTDEERMRLLTVGEYHVGEFINRFRHGSLVMRLTENDPHHPPTPTLLFAGVSGAIGVIATLTPEQHEFFNKLQNALADPRHIGGIGGFKHKDWRSFANDRKIVEATSFIDGDLVELFLDLPRSRQDEVARAVELSTEEVCKRIETLSHALH